MYVCMYEIMTKRDEKIEKERERDKGEERNKDRIRGE